MSIHNATGGDLTLKRRKKDWDKIDDDLAALPATLRHYLLNDCPLDVRTGQVVELYNANGQNAPKTLKQIRELVRASTARTWGPEYLVTAQ